MDRTKHWIGGALRLARRAVGTLLLAGLVPVAAQPTPATASAARVRVASVTSASVATRTPATDAAAGAEPAVILASLPFDGEPFERGPVRVQPLHAVDPAPRGLSLPEPNGWAAIVATIALALFFFLRRVA